MNRPSHMGSVWAFEHVIFVCSCLPERPFVSPNLPSKKRTLHFSCLPIIVCPSLPFAFKRVVYFRPECK